MLRPRCAMVGFAALAAMLLLGAGPVVAATPEATSTSFLLAQSTVASAGGTATSTSFVLDASLGQEAVVGETSSTSFVLQSGFWTSGTDEPVPVELMWFTVSSGETSSAQPVEIRGTQDE